MNERLSDVLNGREDNYLLPFYWLHGDHHDTIPEEVERIYRSGCRALCVESRTHRDFCGEGWWSDMDLILEEAEKRGMKVWFFDDDHYPTGHAAGAVAKHPELRKWQLGERHVDVAGPLEGALLTAEPTDADHILLGVFAYPRAEEDEDLLPEPVDLTGGVKNGFLGFSLPKGVFRVFFLYKTRRGAAQGNYIDMLDERGAKLLLDTVYEPQYERYGDRFGTTIAGFFSDEPQIGNGWYGPHTVDLGGYNHRLGMPGLALPWNDRILPMMREKLGFDPLPYLPALWFGMDGMGGMNGMAGMDGMAGKITGRMRVAYMDAVTILHRDNFTRVLGDWCESHGVMYIGHVIEDMNAHARLCVSGGHYFRSLDGQHMSGIDIVLHQIIPGLSGHFHTASAFGNRADPAFYEYVLAKLASSFAHIGTQTEGRAMCEVFGAYGWAENAGMMKWLIDHLLVRGVNRFIPHAFSPSFPDPDCPPHFGAGGKDPQFEGFTKLMNYTNKAAHLLSGGVLKTQAAILYHAEAEWMNRDGDAMLTQVPAKILYDAHIDYDIIPADCLTGEGGSRVFKARAENGCLAIGSQNYECLIIPAAVELPENVLRAVLELEGKGVPVIRMNRFAAGEELLREISLYIEKDFEVKGDFPLLRCAHFVYPDSDVYMFVNESVCDTADTEITLRDVKAKGSRSCTLLDMLNDKIYTKKVENGVLKLKLEPYRSVIAVFEKEPLVRENVPAEDTLEEGYGRVPAELVFEIRTALYDDPQNYKLAYENADAGTLPNITDVSAEPGFSGKIRYTASFELPNCDSVALDLGYVGSTSHLWLNGEDLGVRICPPYRYDVGNALKEGKNELVIEVANTLGNALRDRFTQFLALPASGITGPVEWIVRAVKA
jgi:hypothetical protein